MPTVRSRPWVRRPSPLAGCLPASMFFPVEYVAISPRLGPVSKSDLFVLPIHSVRKRQGCGHSVTVSVLDRFAVCRRKIVEKI